jgi:glycosyltransferase involved in cell wall biosynthesis
VEVAKRYVHRVVVCDDGSVDRTGDRAAEQGAEVIRLAGHRGYGAALAALFRRGRVLHVDVLVTADAEDLRMLVDIPRLVMPILRGEADVVVGARRLGEGGGAMVGGRESGLMLVTQRAHTAASQAATGSPPEIRAYGRRAVEAAMPTARGTGASTEILRDAAERDCVITEVWI